MYVGLDSGIAMYGDGVASPLLRFAETGKDVSYDMSWERLELVGDSNDVVVVGGGLELEADNASSTLGTTRSSRASLSSTLAAEATGYMSMTPPLLSLSIFLKLLISLLILMMPAATKSTLISIR